MDPSSKLDSFISADDESFQLPESQIAEIAGSHMAEHNIRSNPHNIELNNFINKYGKEITDKSDFNIIDQHRKKKWMMPDNVMPALINILEKFRVNNIPHGISQRQNNDARIYIDGDIKLQSDNSVISNPNAHVELLNQIVAIIMEKTVRKNDNDSCTLYAHFETRSQVTYDNSSTQYKDGFHIRIATMFPQHFRKRIMEIIKKNCKMTYVFDSNEKERIQNINDIIDTNAAAVPALFPGGIKTGGIPYKFVGVYKIDYYYETNQARSRKMSDDDVSKMNISRIFAPVFKSDDDMFTIAPSISPTFQSELNQSNQSTFDEINEDEVRDISIMNINDPQFRELNALLNMLSQTRSENYKDWFNIMCALASYGQKYKALARLFSIKAKIKYDESKFDDDWEKCISKCNTYKFNISTVRSMAMSDDPVAYKQITSSFITETICRYVFEVMHFMDKTTARLGDFHIAEILYTAFPSKYYGVPKRTGSGRKTSDDSDIHYYSMIMPGTPEYTPGAAYKYAELLSLSPLSIYISKKMPIILKQVHTYFRSCRDKPGQDESQIKKYAIALGILGKCYESCINDKTKKSIMRQFAHLVTNFQFEAELDSATYAIGVYDAILETGVRPKLIRDVTNYKLSRFSPSIYVLYDPIQKILIETMQIYIDFIIESEFDVLLYILLFQCRALNRKQKKLMLLNLWGNGSNGKSSIVQFMYTALGKVENRGYAYRLEMDYLVKDRISSGGAQSELMPLEHATYVSMSEPGDGDAILESKWKLLMSGETISARELYGTQRNIVPKSVMVLGSNKAIEFSQGGKNKRRYKYDHGTLRRLAIVIARKKFTATPNPENPLEAKANSKILDEIVTSPVYAGALLSIMSIVHALFIMIHKEDFDTVCSPNVEKQTTEHINNIDTINAFICKTCVVGEKIKVKMNNVIDAYIAWHDTQYCTVSHNRERIFQAFISSRLEKKIVRDEDGEYWCDGVRSLAAGELPSPGEKRYEKDDKYEFKSYNDFELSDGQMLPFNGEIMPTTCASNFLVQLNELHKKYLNKWDNEHESGVNYVLPI